MCHLAPEIKINAQSIGIDMRVPNHKLPSVSVKSLHFCFKIVAFFGIFGLCECMSVCDCSKKSLSENESVSIFTVE